MRGSWKRWLDPTRKTCSYGFRGRNRSIKGLGSVFGFCQSARLGWVGYPGVTPARDQLCFFSGRISAWLEAKHAYLVDGVAISGVSGGPAFFVGSSGKPVLLGVVSAYLPNKAAGTPLPGLSLVQHIGQLDKVVQDLGQLGKEPVGAPPAIPSAPPPKDDPPEA